MDDYRKVLKLVAEKLDSAGIEYMVSGSTALGFYGRPRMTRDIDIVVELPVAKVPQLDFLFSGGALFQEGLERGTVEWKLAILDRTYGDEISPTHRRRLIERWSCTDRAVGPPTGG